MQSIQCYSNSVSKVCENAVLTIASRVLTGPVRGAQPLTIPLPGLGSVCRRGECGEADRIGLDLTP
jgi:hypothetical protein